MRILGIIICMALSFVGCSEGSKEPGTLRSNFYEYPRSFDPRKVSDPISFTMMHMLFEGLTHLDREGIPQMAQAERIDISEDRRTYTFHLGNHRWSNGQPVTASDFAESWRDILKPKFPSVSAHLLYSIKNGRLAKEGTVPLDQVGIRVIDSKTLEVELEEPTPYFLQLTANCTLFPINHEQEKVDKNWAQGDGETYVSNGPFRLVKAEPNQEVIVSKNAQYRGKNKAKLKKIVFCILSDDMSALQLFASDGLDLIAMPLTRIPLSYLKELQERQFIEAKSIAANLFCAFNTTAPPFNNGNIRKALNSAIDRQAIVDHISQLGEEVATHAVPSILREGKKLDFFKDGDAEQARNYLQQGLAELGMKASDFKDFFLLCYPHEITQRVALAIHEQWKQVLKLDIPVKVIPFPVLMEKVYKKEYEVGVFAWMADYNDPMSFFARYASSEDPKNYARWEHPEFGRLLALSSRVENQEERREILVEAERIFMEEMPIAPIYHWKFPYLVKPYVKGFWISPLGQIYFSEVSMDPKF